MRTRTIVVVSAIGLAVSIAFLFLQVAPRGSRTPLPQPNGYDDFLKAGSLLVSDPARVDDLSTEELKTLVTQNAAALAMVRLGLQRQCRVPLGYSMDYATNHLTDLATCKRIVRAFVAEGKLAERENRPSEASRCYLDAVRFGHECCRGGVIIDMLVGVACQSIGGQALQSLAGRLNASDCREATRQLEDLDSRAESAQDFVTQEQAWSRRTFGLRGRLAALVMRQNLQQTAQKAVAKLQTERRAARLRMIQLAERAYELDHGTSPKGKSDLVPAYLKALPAGL